jgi:hypothetical protein
MGFDERRSDACDSRLRELPTEEVDDDAAVAAAAGGHAEVGLAVWRLGEGDLRRLAVGAEVARVRDGVAEVEDGIVLLRRRGQRARRAEQRQHQRRRPPVTAGPHRRRPKAGRTNA